MTLFRNVNIVKENTVETGEVLVRDGKIAEAAMDQSESRDIPFTFL